MKTFKCIAWGPQQATSLGAQPRVLKVQSRQQRKRNLALRKEGEEGRARMHSSPHVQSNVFYHFNTFPHPGQQISEILTVWPSWIHKQHQWVSPFIEPRSHLPTPLAPCYFPAVSLETLRLFVTQMPLDHNRSRFWAEHWNVIKGRGCSSTVYQLLSICKAWVPCLPPQ